MTAPATLRRVLVSGPRASKHHDNCSRSRLITFLKRVVYIVLLMTVLFYNFQENAKPNTINPQPTWKDASYKRGVVGKVQEHFEPTANSNAGDEKANRGTENRAPTAKETKEKHKVAGLSCDRFGGPTDPEAVASMVYWRDIPVDANFKSPLQHPTEEQFLTFEIDEGGWNNIRMGMETAVAVAVATGRTLVLPPKMQMYRLWDGGSSKNNVMGFSDFFHLDSVVAEHSTLNVITFQEFLEQHVMAGQLLHAKTGKPTFPPGNRTDWTGAFWNFEQTRSGIGKPLWEWMRNVTTPLEWSFSNCVVGLPSRRGAEAADHLQTYLQQVMQKDKELHGGVWSKRRQTFNGNPVPVNASPADRLSEILAHRQKLCIYDDRLQNARVVHGYGENSSGFRLLIHFYAFLFFEDWKHDLWLKRFIRDHFRYLDEIQCAATRIVQRVRQKAVEHGNPEGQYHSIHVRRGDFFSLYKIMELSAEEIYNNNTRLRVPDASTVYIATDEQNKTFFAPIKEHYNVFFLDDFMDEIPQINPNYYGMLDQLIASRGKHTLDRIVVA